MNRLRVRFGRGVALKFISHLDLTRVWHRALRRAGIALAYSEGFNPHPRLSLAAPLQLGATSEAELMDVYTVQPLAAATFADRLRMELPLGLDIMQVVPVRMNLPALQAQVRFADYLVKVNALDEPGLGQAILALLECRSLPWQHQRDTGVKSYDLRPLIASLRLTAYMEGVATLDMRLRSDASGTGRPEQVVRALGLDSPLDIHRTRLILGTT
ncbi:MAG: TIGR03936 family radical SAM-associated protein [Dehalococcoidia bacterium]|nr:TIGR03936 family radical SAM-associated protein [Dehalococcoidia bacterium]